MNEELISGRVFHPAICVTCDDVHAVAANPDGRGSVPCPDCGDTEKRRALFARRVALPELRVRDLTPEEREIVAEWHARGFHELDCLRWIEGRRYDPRLDRAFLREEFRAEGEWREAWNATEPARPLPKEAPERPIRAALPPAPVPTTEIPAPPYVPGPLEVTDGLLDESTPERHESTSERTNEPEEVENEPPF